MKNLISVRKLPWPPALETVMAADNADEDSEQVTSGSGNGDPG